MSDATTHPPGWYPDPHGRHQLRYYDGSAWTDHVSSNGRQEVDPVNSAPENVPTTSASAAAIERQVQQQAGVQPTAGGGGGSIFTEPILVVNQKARLIEINNEYAIYDQGGTQIGAVRQVGQSTAKKVLRVVSNLDQYMTHHLQVVDQHGNVVLSLTRPAKLVKSKIVVNGADGQPIGEIVQQNMIGKIRFGLQAGGADIGSINAENWRAWNFNILDHTGTEVARITKTWEGMAKAMFTTADNYVVQIHRPLADPLRAMVVASAVSVDTALKQDSRGFN